MLDDPRCCGSGTCIINAEGLCWCGQLWEGDRLLGPASACAAPTVSAQPAQARTAEAHTLTEPTRAPAHPAHP
ncbi:MAG: hypothetical protein RI907_3337 [Pseudomonadota bacterium]|jgi:hypothetical protein